MCERFTNVLARVQTGDNNATKCSETINSFAWSAQFLSGYQPKRYLTKYALTLPDSVDGSLSKHHTECCTFSGPTRGFLLIGSIISKDFPEIECQEHLRINFHLEQSRNREGEYDHSGCHLWTSVRFRKVVRHRRILSSRRELRFRKVSTVPLSVPWSSLGQCTVKCYRELVLFVDLPRLAMVSRFDLPSKIDEVLES